MPRKLDFAESASIDVVTLNNKVVLMRPIIHTAKYQIVQKMVRHLRHLRKKKGSEEQLAQNKRKVDRLVEDMYAMKKLRHSRISKFALANTLTFDQICKQPGCTAETRALGRFANHKAMKEAVNKFRAEHPDWKSLAEFLLGHVPRRFNKNKYLYGEENVEAGNQLVKSYLQNKMTDKDIYLEKKDKNEDAVSDKVVKNNKNETDRSKKDSPDDNSNKNKVTKVKTETKTSKVENEKNTSTLASDKQNESHGDTSKQIDILGNTDVSDEILNNSDKDSDLDSENLEEDDKHSESDLENSGTEDKNELEEESENENSDLENLLSDAQTDSSDHEETENESDSQVESENEDQNKVEGEMVVKKLNMEELISGNNENVPAFLISSHCEENIAHKKKSNDSFFMLGEGDESENENLSDEKEDSESDENESKFPIKRTSINSSFMGALNEEKPKYNRFDNSDRGGRGEGTFMERRGRGRGQFGDRRGYGRGQFDNIRGRGRGHFDDRRGRGRGQFGDRRGRGHDRYGQDRFSNYDRKGDFGSRGRGRGRSFDNPQKQYGSHNQGNKSSAGSKDVSKAAEKIHPSWEASKKRKEHATIQAFQGKKIKFDDN